MSYNECLKSSILFGVGQRRRAIKDAENRLKQAHWELGDEVGRAMQNIDVEDISETAGITIEECFRMGNEWLRNNLSHEELAELDRGLVNND